MSKICNTTEDACKTPDHSYPREHAESYVRAGAGALRLNELAKLVSELPDRGDYPVSVRDINTSPISHSHVYFRGAVVPVQPYLVRRS